MVLAVARIRCGSRSDPGAKRPAATARSAPRSWARSWAGPGGLRVRPWPWVSQVGDGWVGALPPTASSARFPVREAAEGVPGAGRGMRCTLPSLPEARRGSSALLLPLSAPRACAREQGGSPGFQCRLGSYTGLGPPPPSPGGTVRRCCAALCWAPISVAPGDCSEQQAKQPEGGGSPGGQCRRLLPSPPGLAQDSSPQTCTVSCHISVSSFRTLLPNQTPPSPGFPTPVVVPTLTLLPSRTPGPS